MTITIKIRDWDYGEGVFAPGYANFNITDGTTAYWSRVSDIPLGLDEAGVQANLDARADTLWIEAQASGKALEGAELQEAIGDAALLPHLGVLVNLAPYDRVYALLARMGAVHNGESQATIDLIISRQSAANYIQSTTQWQNLSPAQRQWAILELEMICHAFQVVIAKQGNG